MAIPPSHPAALIRRRRPARNWRRIAAEASLPAEVRAVVNRVVRRCRLRRRESAAVAAELAGHFADADAAGVATAKAVADFGDPIVAARLIRRAMLRRRSRAWHILRWTRRGLVVVLIMYVMLAGIFYAGRPSPTVDYLAVLNQDAMRTPVQERAWPLYRQAILEMGRPRWPDFIAAPFDGPGWPRLAEFVADHEGTIELVRHGADKPVLGFILGPGGSIEDPPIYRRLPRSTWMLMDPEDWRFITTSFSNPYIGGWKILLGDRDGVIVGIALERYRRQHGDYPQTLADLVPEFLPAIPADRITGNPVKYHLRAGKPLVYSVGSDRVDNSGTPGIGLYGPDPTVAAIWPPMMSVIRGDWILYPHAK